MSLERVLGFFESKGMAERVLILDESSATVEFRRNGSPKPCRF